MQRLSLALVAIVLVGCSHELHRTTSPDGAFEVIVRAGPRLFAMPGGGRDGPGEIEIVRRSDGRSCGVAPLELVQLEDDLRFEPARACIPVVAEWDLAACSVTLVGEH